MAWSLVDSYESSYMDLQLGNETFLASLKSIDFEPFQIIYIIMQPLGSHPNSFIKCVFISDYSSYDKIKMLSKGRQK